MPRPGPAWLSISLETRSGLSSPRLSLLQPPDPGRRGTQAASGLAQSHPRLSRQGGRPPCPRALSQADDVAAPGGSHLGRCGRGHGPGRGRGYGQPHPQQTPWPAAALAQWPGGHDLEASHPLCGVARSNSALQVQRGVFAKASSLGLGGWAAAPVGSLGAALPPPPSATLASANTCHLVTRRLLGQHSPHPPPRMTPVAADVKERPPGPRPRGAPTVLGPSFLSHRKPGGRGNSQPRRHW